MRLEPVSFDLNTACINKYLWKTFGKYILLKLVCFSRISITMQGDNKYVSLPDGASSMEDSNTTVAPSSGSTSRHIYVFILPVVCVMVGMAALGVTSVLVPNLFSKSTIHRFFHPCLWTDNIPIMCVCLPVCASVCPFGLHILKH